MNLTYFYPQIRGNVVNTNNRAVNIRFVAKTSDIRNFSENNRSDAKTSEVATVVETHIFEPEPLWNSDNQKLSNFKIDFFTAVQYDLLQ